MLKQLLLALLIACTAYANPENACLVMSNAAGTGTGFIVKQRGGYYLVSNQHVINGPAPHKYEKSDGIVLRPLKGWLAGDRDIVIYSLDGTHAHYLEVETEFDAVALGEEVMIYGNALGEGMRLSEAKIIRKTSSEIEISGGIVPGNSGGPIIRKKNGKLLAVATYATVHNTQFRSISDYVEAAGLPKVRFYGVRIDTITSPVDFDLKQFLQEAAQLEADAKQLDRAAIMLIMLSMKLGADLSPEISQYVRRAEQSHHRALSMLEPSGLYPGTYSPVAVNAFRRASDPLFSITAKPVSYIHRNKQTALENDQKFLWSTYAKLLRSVPVR
ncbi:MAG: hypothetical protein K0R17_86 [Rariglobus sp.]|nr:hypothetical protein [Rariglobus sp.]